MQEAVIAIIIGIIVVAAGAAFIVMQQPPTGKADLPCPCYHACNTILPAIASSSTNNSVTVSWTYKGNRTELQRSENASTWTKIYEDTVPQQTEEIEKTYTDTNVSNGTKYYYRAINYGHGHENDTPFCECLIVSCSFNSSTVNATPVATPAQPTANAGNAQATVSWGTITGAINYRVQRNGTELPNTITAPTTSFTDTSLTNGQQYYYNVKACSSGTNCSAWSAQSNIVVPSSGGLAPSVNPFGPYKINLSLNNTVQLKGTATDSDGTISSIDWASSDCTVLSPTRLGLGTAAASIIATLQCTALGAKTATLTATDNSNTTTTAEAQIDVYNLKIDSASTNKSSYNAGEIITFNASWVSSIIPVSIYFCKTGTIDSTPPYCRDGLWCSIPDSSANSGNCTYNSSSADIGTKNYYSAIFNSKGYWDRGPEGSFAITAFNDTQAPAVTIAAPQNNSTVSGTATISADANDNIGVSKVEFYIDNSIISTDTSAPYSYSWNTTQYSNTIHSIKAKAYDAADNNSTTLVNVTVNNTLQQPPDIPTGLYGIIDDGKAILKWNKVSAATSYSLHWRVSIQLKGTIPNITDANYVHSNIPNGTAHYYSVSACNNAGCSNPSEPEVSVTPMACTIKGDVSHDNKIDCTDWQWIMGMLGLGYPLKQMDMCGELNGDGKISISDAVKLGQDYNLNCGTIDVIPPKIEITAPLNYTTVTGIVDINANITDNVGVTKAEFYIDSDLNLTDTTAPYSYSWDTINSTDGAHTIKVKAYDAAGNNDSNSIAVTVNNDGYGPPKIKSFSCTPSSHSITANWNVTGSPAIYYTLSRGLSSGSYTAIPAATNITLTQYIDSGLDNGTTYYYKLKAANNYNGGSSVESTCNAIPQASYCGNNIIESNEECDGSNGCYQSTRKCDTVSRKYGTRDVYCNNSCKCIIEGWTWSTSTSSGSDYCNECVSCGDDQCNCSETKSSCPADCGGTINDTTPPAKPTGLNATPGNGSVELSWNENAETDLVGYIVYYGASSGSYGTDTIETQYNSATVYDLGNGTTYYFSVKAIDSSSNYSSFSNEVSSTPQASNANAPNPPNNLSASYSSGKVELDWSAPSSGADSYEIYRKLSTEGSYEKIGSSISTSYEDEGLTKGKTYDYRVKSVKNSLKSNYSSKASITIPGTAECNPAKDDYCDPNCTRGKDPDCPACVKNAKCEKDFNESFTNCPEDCKEGVDIASPEMGLGAGIVAVAAVIAIVFFKLIPGT